MSVSSHLHGHDIKVVIYDGLCEVVNNHYHPMFLLFFINMQKKDFSATTQMIDNINNHLHTCILSKDEIQYFVKKKEVAVATSFCATDNHQHKIFFNVNQQQKQLTKNIIDEIIFLEA